MYVIEANKIDFEFNFVVAVIMEPYADPQRLQTPLLQDVRKKFH
jgi:hypothetical protein